MLPPPSTSISPPSEPPKSRKIHKVEEKDEHNAAHKHGYRPKDPHEHRQREVEPPQPCRPKMAPHHPRHILGRHVHRLPTEGHVDHDACIANSGSASELFPLVNILALPIQARRSNFVIWNHINLISNFISLQYLFHIRRKTEEEINVWLTCTRKKNKQWVFDTCLCHGLDPEPAIDGVHAHYSLARVHL